MLFVHGLSGATKPRHTKCDIDPASFVSRCAAMIQMARSSDWVSFAFRAELEESRSWLAEAGLAVASDRGGTGQEKALQETTANARMSLWMASKS